VAHEKDVLDSIDELFEKNRKKKSDNRNKTKKKRKKAPKKPRMKPRKQVPPPRTTAQMKSKPNWTH